jgi:putative ABC transport system permease protein
MEPSAMLLDVAFHNLRRNMRRTLAVVLTVAVGTGSLFIFHGFNAGIMNQYRDNTVHSRYGHGEINMRGYRDQTYEKPWEHWIPADSRLPEALRGIPGVTHVFPRVSFFALLSRDDVTVSGRGQGIDAATEATFFNTLNIEEGANLTTEPDGVMLGRGLARALGVHVGDRVTAVVNTVRGSLNAVDLHVVGIFHTGAKDFDDVMFRIPLAAAQTLLDTGRLESVAVGLTGTDAWAEVARFVRERHPELDAIPFAELDRVYYQHSVDWLNSQFGIIQIIILAIVVLGIFNTISTSILERKAEIGNLRANGESTGAVLTLLLLEGGLMGAAGAVAGLGIASLLNATALAQGLLMPPAPGITRQFHVFIELQPRMAVSTFLLGAATALAGTLVAGLRVVRLDIAEALRST